MKKNKRTRRIFSRVLHRLSRANVCRFYGANENAYKEVLAAKRLIEGFGGEEIKVVFYEREYHIQFTLLQRRDRLNRYYTVSASHGYENDYHDTNKSHVNALISSAEFVRYCRLRRNYRDYQAFRQYGNRVLVWGLEPNDFDNYTTNGNIANIPYDVAIKLWRDLGKCLSRIIDEAIAHKKEVL